MSNETWALAIFPFNRKHYIVPTIEGLLKNPESQGMPFYFFIDGSKSDQEVQKVHEVVERSNRSNQGSFTADSTDEHG